MAAVSIKGVRKSFGATEVIRGVDLDIEDGAFCVFVGPSGCGKSTLLRLVAGLEDISAGELWIGGAQVNDRPPKDRGIAMVFQSYALYPHMNVRDNMAFGLKLAGATRAERDARIAEAARILKIDHLLDRKPRQLSGGQRQRVAIGRAIVRAPEVFLFDEPLSNLDAALRVETRIEIAKLHRQLGATMIYVTHDQVEAMTLADTIVVLNRGRIEQAGAPMDLYARPANLFVAGFIGSPMMNLLPATVAEASSDRVTLRVAADVELEAPRPARYLDDRNLTLGVRPEHLQVADDGPLRGEIAAVERLGGETCLHVDIGLDRPVVARMSGDARLSAGDNVGLHATAGDIHLFGADGLNLVAADASDR